MTKFDYEILMLLYQKNVDNPLKAMNISQILEEISVAKRKSYSTTYRHLQSMSKQGYQVVFRTESGKGYLHLIEDRIVTRKLYYVMNGKNTKIS